jgi:N-acetylmuramoyl-L-alanine amidase
MRILCLSLLLFAPGRIVYSAAQQQLIPIIHQTQASPSPAYSEWKTFLRVADYGGVTYVSLVQVSELLNGHLRWHAVSKHVDLSMYGHTIRFPYYSAVVQVNGHRVHLEQPTVKNEDGFWVPISFFASDAFFKVTHTKLEWPPRPEEQQVKGEGRGEDKATESQTSQVSAQTSVSPHPSPLSPHVIKRIVIDPGHGGKDPGAVGPHGTQEKNVNLRLAQELADSLRETYGYEVLLTRMDDTFIPLEERAQLANKHNADLFISLHCNASPSPKRKGFEVYFLSERASDSHADAVARLENAVLAYEGKEIPSPNRVKEVLRSLVKTANINEASALGSLLDRHLAERLYEPSSGVKQAAFYVLRGAEMPAVLIETGFISNNHEEQLLVDDGFRQKLIEAISAGVVEYDERRAKERR